MDVESVCDVLGNGEIIQDKTVGSGIDNIAIGITHIFLVGSKDVRVWIPFTLRS